MTISALFIRILVLALPVLLGSLFYRKLRGGGQQKDWRDLAEITLFAPPSYAIYGGALELAGTDGPAALEALFNETVPVRWGELVIASGVSMVLAVAASYAHQWKLINRFGQSIGATSRYGDEDVWEYFHNSFETGLWMFVRDHKLGLVYFGWIDSYSESGQDRELLLRDVQVFSNEEDELLYEVPVLYVARQRDDFTLEIPEQATEDESDE